MIKQCILNFFRRFKYSLICFGLIILGFLGAAGIFYGGLYLTLNLQDGTLLEEVKYYFQTGFSNLKPTDILSLSILTKIYNDMINIAGEQAYNVKVGLTLSAIIAVFAIYGAYKGSVGLVNYLNKRKLRNQKTKHGFTPFVIKICIGLLFSFILMILLHLWAWSSLIILTIYVIIDSFEAVVSTRYIFFSDRSLKDFIFSKDFIRVMGLFLICQYLLIIIASALWFVTPFISLFVMIPLMAYSETNVRYTIVEHFKKV